MRKKKRLRTATLIREHLKNVKDLREKLYYLVQLYKTETISPHYWSHVRIGWEVANLLSSSEEIPTIALEFMYIFGMELLSNGIKEGEKLLKYLIKLVPGYPDPYCGYAIYYFNQKEYEKSYEFAKQ
ncbi:MAG: glycosyltransferase, partial [Pseudothermotoga sp.]